MSAFSENEVSPEERLESSFMEIQSAFEASPESGVDKFTEVVNSLTKGEQADPDLAGQLAERLIEQIPEMPPELQNQLEIKLGEALLYGGHAGNDRLETSLTYYQQAKKRAGEKLPENLEEVPEAKLTREVSEFLHSTDRMADLAFLAGDYASAEKAFADAFEKRGEISNKERGPAACAKYGQAASALMIGNIRECLSDLAEAKKILEDLEDQEPVLFPKIEKLEAVAEAADELEPDAFTRRLGAMKELLTKQGGSKGGVKRIDFQEVFDEAEMFESSPEIET
ncbi:hypothetical protein C4546_04645 [Candidatus Parcubacteria bacterium]|jgi:tetratricopeptide (TPR) repeat protein|nr:MAG: hypothetical protein C4546_04645 [Candidatus Parcubacteria bacterium]